MGEETVLESQCLTEKMEKRTHQDDWLKNICIIVVGHILGKKINPEGAQCWKRHKVRKQSTRTPNLSIGSQAPLSRGWVGQRGFLTSSMAQGQACNHYQTKCKHQPG